MSYICGTKINTNLNFIYLTKYKPFVKRFFKKNTQFHTLGEESHSFFSVLDEMSEGFNDRVIPLLF